MLGRGFLIENQRKGMSCHIQVKCTLYRSLCVAFNRFSDNVKNSSFKYVVINEGTIVQVNEALFIGVVLDDNFKCP